VTASAMSVLRSPSDEQELPHGLARYRRKCPCEICRAANTAAQRRWRRQRAYGRVFLVDAEPVRAHVKTLQAFGLGANRIAALAQVNPAVVRSLLYGASQRVQPSRQVLVANAEKLQALAAIGWSQPLLARKLGIEPSNFRLMNAVLVRGRTARAVKQLYEQLWNSQPPAQTPTQRAAITIAKKRAAAHGWLPPMAWDDDTIDLPDTTTAEVVDPAAEEFVDEVAVELAVCGKPPARLTHAERVAAAQRMAAAGTTPSAIAKHLRASYQTVSRILKEAS
jgi:hypothetical protein